MPVVAPWTTSHHLAPLTCASPPGAHLLAALQPFLTRPAQNKYYFSSPLSSFWGWYALLPFTDMRYLPFAKFFFMFIPIKFLVLSMFFVWRGEGVGKKKKCFSFTKIFRLGISLPVCILAARRTNLIPADYRPVKCQISHRLLSLALSYYSTESV